METPWYLRSRRRYFLDYHIDGWNDEFLSKYDPEVYAQACLDGNGTAATYMANTHSGLLNWPSKLGGTLHPALKGRDMLRETIDALHKRGLDAIVYYVFVYVVDYWEKHPSARSRFSDGTVIRQSVGTREREHRFATCCINDDGYRRRALNELGELCENYDFEGIWPDMTFWPTVCYCEHCRRRYKKETGCDIPEIIDWKDKDFVRFVRTRQRWLVEFCDEITQIIREKKPGMKYAQQSQTFVWDWMAGASAELADCWDWMSADLYSDRYGLSYSSKFFYGLSRIKPFERVNCWNYPNIHEHAVTRSEDELNQIAYSTIMNDGALTVIDQINPDGTLHLRNYEKMRRVFEKIEPYEPYLGGEFRQDVAIYYSFYSNMDQEWNGRNVSEAVFTLDPRRWEAPFLSEHTHMACAENVAKTLTLFHIPYGVMTKKNLKELHNYKVLILPNVTVMDADERQAIRSFVESGGCLYASRETATIDADGTYTGSFFLEDLFGVSMQGQTKEVTTYISPGKEGQKLFPSDYTAQFPMTVHDWQMKVKAVSDTIHILGTMTLPYEYPCEERYASLLTTPPGRFTDKPSLTENTYGKGRVIYCAALLEAEKHISQREVFYRIIKSLGKSFCTELMGYPSVEITRFEKPEQNQTMLHILNYQAELPSVPIYNLSFRAQRNGKNPKRVILLPKKIKIPYEIKGDELEITLPYLDTYSLVCIEY